MRGGGNLGGCVVAFAGLAPDRVGVMMRGEAAARRGVFLRLRTPDLRSPAMKWHRGVSGMVVLVTLAIGAAARADTITHGSTTITMDFVNIGNAGNAADDTTYGAVGYDYRIGKYEVTADQWKAVVAADPNVGNAPSWAGSQPAGGISWNEAARFCNWLTTGDANSGVYNTSTWAIMDHQLAAQTFGRAYFLPTQDEWYKAAYYDPNKNGPGNGGYWDYPTQPASSNVPPDGIDFNGDAVFDAVFDDG